MIGYLALLFLIIILVIYFAVTVAVVYHFKHYNLSGKFTKKAMTIFLTVSLVFFILNIVSFAWIPWKEISQNISESFQSHSFLR
jgi:hypothetical protein